MVIFLTEQPDSGMYGNWHIMRQNSHLHPRVYELDPKTKQMEGGIQDYNKGECPESCDTTSTYICRQFGVEVTNECGKHQDSSVHWWKNSW